MVVVDGNGRWLTFRPAFRRGKQLADSVGELFALPTGESEAEELAIGIGGHVLNGGHGSVSRTNGRPDSFYPKHPMSPPDTSTAVSVGLRQLGIS